jgi:transglutaminase-like putative cysteine protease
MVEPARGAALLLFCAAAAAAAAGVALAGRLPAPGRLAVAAGAVIILAVLALLCAGAPARLLLPSGWAELAVGITEGVQAVPNVNVPYAGEEAWVSVAILLGAPILLGCAALVACWPRRHGRFGWPFAAAVPLAAVVAVPAVQQPDTASLLDGAVLAVLLVVFLGLDRVPRRAAPLAAGLMAVATVTGVLVAPALDRDEPLIDYEAIAQSLAPADGTRFSWNHEYGPMDWSRDGSEVLRVRATRGTYWKTVALSEFNGKRWVRDSFVESTGVQTEIDRSRPEWIQRVRMSIRGMTTEEFVGAGTTLSISKSPRQPVVSGPGEFRVEDRPLRSGHTYEVEAYVPRPSRRALAVAGTEYPAFVSDALTIRLPRELSASPRPEVRFAPFGSAEPVLATIGGAVVAGEEAQAVLERSAYARTYALAQRLRAGAPTPDAFVRAVERHLTRGFTYSESPRWRAVPLDAFLFEDREGYCQQFSGAMALLLRMGGVPARVAAGFSPGRYDEERREYVVRDLDAHSWVEVYVPGSGWVAFDPTPSDAPASSRELASAPSSPRDAPADPGPVPRDQRDRTRAPVDPVAAEEAADGGLPRAPLVAVGVIGLLGMLLWLAALRRRKARARAPVQTALDDLERALRRSGHPPAPHTTLGVVAEALAGSPGEAYVRTLERARYGGAGEVPGPRERAGLRRALGARAGRLGRLRAWWALPPS